MKYVCIIHGCKLVTSNLELNSPGPFMPKWPKQKSLF